MRHVQLRRKGLRWCIFFLIGTFINTGAIVAGATLGVALGGRLPEKVTRTVMQGIGLFTLLLGVKMALTESGALIVIFSIVLGAVIGELLDIEAALERLGKWAEERFSRESTHGSFGKAFVSTTLLYCVGPMAITGAITDGLQGDYTILLTKSMMDGLSAIAFASALGIGVGLSAVTVFLYQGGLTLLASLVSSWMTQSVINDMTAVGGILIAAIGINILEIIRIRVGNLLPGLFVAMGLSTLIALF